MAHPTLRKTYKVRESASGRGIELSLPVSLKHDGIFNVGDMVDVYYGDFIVITPPGKTIDYEKANKLFDLIEFAVA